MNSVAGTIKLNFAHFSLQEFAKKFQKNLGSDWSMTRMLKIT